MHDRYLAFSLNYATYSPAQEHLESASIRISARSNWVLVPAKELSAELLFEDGLRPITPVIAKQALLPQ